DDVDLATKLGYVDQHDVHADPAAGDAGDLLLGREARRENEARQLLVAQAADLVLGRKARCNGPPLDLFDVDAATIVADLHHDAIALLLGDQPQRSSS